MKFLITGATGYIGNFILQHLSEIYGKENIDIYIRSLKKAENLKKLANSIFIVDLASGDLSFLRSKSYNYIIIAHGKILGHTYRGIYLNNRKAVRNILKNLNKNNLREIVYISSVAAKGFKDDMIDHNQKPQPANAYGIAKLKTEEILLRYGKANNINVTIFRPPVVYGKISGIDFDYFIKACKIGYMPYIAGNPYISLCSVDNLIHAIMRALEKESNGIYEIADDKRYNIQEVVNTIRRAYGLKGIKTKGQFLRPIVNTLVKAMLMFNNFSFPSLFMLQIIHNPFYCNIDKAKEELGYKPKDIFDEYFNKLIAEDYFSNKVN